MDELKTVVLGDVGVGKSALTVRFVQNIFVERYDPTIEDSYRKMLTVDGRMCCLEVLDTAGCDEYTAMRDLYLRNSFAYVYVYSLTAPATFKSIDALHANVLRVRDVESVPCVVVANKCDLTGDRAVSRDDGEALAKRIGAAYFETSAKVDTNVQATFQELVRLSFPAIDAAKASKQKQDKAKKAAAAAKRAKAKSASAATTTTTTTATSATATPTPTPAPAPASTTATTTSTPPPPSAALSPPSWSAVAAAYSPSPLLARAADADATSSITADVAVLAEVAWASERQSLARMHALECRIAALDPASPPPSCVPQWPSPPPTPSGLVCAPGSWTPPT